ncbi:MAG: hypothetical protein WC526_02350 [Patescibacteria group bacterium]
MSISEQTIQDFKKLYAEKYHKEISSGEAEMAIGNLVGLVEVLLKIDEEEVERKRRLKYEPKGFHLNDGTYNCGICGTSVSGDSCWYDKFGIKCMICQRAINKHIIPGSLCYKDTWYKIWELEHYYDLDSSAVRQLLREGKLKARIIPRENGRPYFYLFIIRENQGVLHKKPKLILRHEENGYVSVKYPKLTLG